MKVIKTIIGLPFVIALAIGLSVTLAVVVPLLVLHQYFFDAPEDAEMCFDRRYFPWQKNFWKLY